MLLLERLKQVKSTISLFLFFPSGAELNVYFFKELYIRQTRKENGTHIINTFSWESGGNGKKKRKYRK